MYFFMNESGYNVGPFGMDENPNNTNAFIPLYKVGQLFVRYLFMVVFAIRFGPPVASIDDTIIERLALCIKDT